MISGTNNPFRLFLNERHKNGAIINLFLRKKSDSNVWIADLFILNNNFYAQRASHSQLAIYIHSQLLFVLLCRTAHKCMWFALRLDVVRASLSRLFIRFDIASTHVKFAVDRETRSRRQSVQDKMKNAENDERESGGKIELYVNGSCECHAVCRADVCVCFET